jgi:hypothetical protein
VGTLSFYTAIDYHWLSLLRDLHSNLAAIDVILYQNDSNGSNVVLRKHSSVVFCQNDSVAPGYPGSCAPRNAGGCAFESDVTRGSELSPSLQCTSQGSFFPSNRV